MKRALITGIGGQDGSLLAELLLESGYEVWGIVRPGRSKQHENLGLIRGRIELVDADLHAQRSLVDALERCRPHEVYNLASVSFVPASWEQPVQTAKIAAVGVTSLLEAIRRVDHGVRFYQASSSEIFGQPLQSPQNEETPLRPLTPYGVAKAYAHFLTAAYRRRYGFYACSGILYNHESPRRPVDFLPRKVARAAAAIRLGLETELTLGNLDARRDWGAAVDYVEARLERLREHGSLTYAREGGASQPRWRRLEGEEAAWLGSANVVRGARDGHGRRGPRGPFADSARNGTGGPPVRGHQRRLGPSRIERRLAKRVVAAIGHRLQAEGSRAIRQAGEGRPHASRRASFEAPLEDAEPVRAQDCEAVPASLEALLDDHSPRLPRR
jgi:GDP-D-mannose dehydratase